MASQCLISLLICLPTFARTFPYDYGAQARRAIPVRPYTFITRQVCGTMIIDPATGSEILQGFATDGGGKGYDAPALLWIMLAMALGLPLAVVGVHGGRFTSGAGLGLVLMAGTWTTAVNIMSAGGIPDTTILLVVLIVFIVGFTISFVVIDRRIGIACLAIAGGLSLGIRIVLLRDGLLFSIFFLNWAFVAFLGVTGGFIVVYCERLGVIVSSTASGTFLFFLGMDLAVNQQRGISRGLRFLFDRNVTHLSDILGNGYRPPVSTKALISLSLAFVPILSLAQNRPFRRPFWARVDSSSGLVNHGIDRNGSRSEDSNGSSNSQEPVVYIGSPMNVSRSPMIQNAEVSRFSL